MRFLYGTEAQALLPILQRERDLAAGLDTAGFISGCRGSPPGALYQRLAEAFTKVWLESGALTCVELEADDAPPGKLISFPQSVDLKPDEKVFVAAATYEWREKRDEVNTKAMLDTRMTGMEMCFDGKRMIFGGFRFFAGDSARQGAAAPQVQRYCAA